MIDHTIAFSPAGSRRPESGRTRERRVPSGDPTWIGVAAVAVALLAVPVRADTQQGNALPIEVEVAGLVEAEVSRVRAVLLDLERFGRWFPATDEWRVLERPEAGLARVYGRQALPWPVNDRDYVVEYRWWDEEGVFVLRATALVDHEPAAPDGVVRIERMRTEWRIEPVPDGTAVRYRYEGDAGGRLPGWVARAGWRSQTPIVVERLREEVARRVADRAAAPGEPAEQE